MARYLKLSIAFLESLDRRFKKARSGSVLIFVVALLVLLALMGTAYITSAHVDRYSAQQNSFNTEIDLLLQAVVQMEQDLIHNASNAPSSAAVGPTYHHWNSPADENWWGSRVPVMMASNQPGWRFVAVSPTGVPFESPYTLNGQPVTYTTRENLVTTSIPVNVNGQTVQYPAFFDSSSGQTYLAASASGDGIADSGLWRIPIGELNGITYYAAVRVLDNNSALNASVADARNTTASPPGDFFPTNVDLQGLLVGGQPELASLDYYRDNNGAPVNPVASLQPCDDAGNPMTTFKFASAYDAMWHQLGRRLANPGWNVAPSARYQSLSNSDAVALAYRFCLMNSSASPSVVEQALQYSLLNAGKSNFVPTAPYAANQVAQWYADNFAYDTQETPGSPGTYLPRRALMAAHTPVSNFAPNRYHHDNSWNFYSPGSPTPHPPGEVVWNVSGAYTYGDWVLYDGRSYVCIRPTGDGQNVPPVTPVGETETIPDPANPGVNNVVPISTLVWAPMPWNNYPTRTGVNTAQFAQLWLAFWNVMADTQTSVPAGTDTRMFRNPVRSAVNVNAGGGGNGGPVSVAPTGGDDTATVQAAIDSSSPGSIITFAGTYHISSALNFLPNRTYTGGPGGGAAAGLTPYQTLQLRAALAAVNAEQLRLSNLSSGNPLDVVSRSIALGGSSTPTGGGATGAIFTWTGSGDDRIAGLSGDSITVNSITFTLGRIQIMQRSDSIQIYNCSFMNVPSNPIFFVSLTNSSISYNNFQDCGGTSIYCGAGSTILNCHFDWNTFTRVKEGIHLFFGKEGASGNDSVSYNYVDGYTRIGIELQEVVQGLQVINNYIKWGGTDINGGSIGLSCATGQDQYSTWGKDTTGVEIAYNILFFSPGPSHSSAAIEIYGNGGNIHNNYANGWNQFVIYAWTAVSGSNPWYITNNTLVNCGVVSAPEGYGPTIPPTTSGNIQTGSAPAPAWPMVGPNAPPAGTTGGPVVSSAALTFTISVFGSAPQPYITEVYANNSNATQSGYVAVELYNPYNFDITMTNWRLGRISRPTGQVQRLVPAPLASTSNWDTTPPTIKAGGRLLLVSSATPPSTVTNPPKLDSNSSMLVLSDLVTAFDSELALFRPRRADGTLWWMTANPLDAALNHYDPSNLYDERINLGDFVPVDSYDFTGLHAAAQSTDAEWHYIRPNDPTKQKAWHFVYPGAYVNSTPAAGGAAPNPTPQPRLVGTDVISPARQGGIDLSSLGQADATQTNQANYQDAPIQVNNTDFSPASARSTTPPTYPMGGFARDGDLLQVTYVGAYTIKNSANNAILEMNPITMDSAFADDPDMTKVSSPAQNIGRFCPIHPADLGFGMNDPAAPYNDYHAAGSMPAPSTADWSSKWSAYHFTLRFFDFLTVQAPHDDYLPNISPTNPDGSTNTMVQPIANADSNIVNALTTNTPANSTEDNVPIEGLININTAPWRVLSALPMANDPTANKQLAQAIVYYRDVDDGSLGAGNPHPHGPFQSIWDLNAVPGFRTTLSTYAGTYNPAITAPVDADGYLTTGATPGGSNQAGFVYNDFETQNLGLTRISNLVTTRSDIFTVYVLVQGFRNAGTANPELMVQRRAAFIADRSRIIPSNKALTILNVPNN